MKSAKIGFMPLYIKLYDDCGLQDIRDRLEPFYEKMACGFEEHGITVVRSAFCCVKAEFEAAVAKFESEGVLPVTRVDRGARKYKASDYRYGYHRYI